MMDASMHHADKLIESVTHAQQNLERVEIEREIEREMLPMTPGTGEVGQTLKAVLGQVEGGGGEESGSAEFETGD